MVNSRRNANSAFVFPIPFDFAAIQLAARKRADQMFSRIVNRNDRGLRHIFKHEGLVQIKTNRIRIDFDLGTFRCHVIPRFPQIRPCIAGKSILVHKPHFAQFAIYSHIKNNVAQQTVPTDELCRFHSIGAASLFLNHVGAAPDRPQPKTPIRIDGYRRKAGLLVRLRFVRSLDGVHSRFPVGKVRIRDSPKPSGLFQIHIDKRVMPGSRNVLFGNHREFSAVLRNRF